jgi:phosphohistidine phosphatase
MKTLYLLRHAKSSWSEPGLGDEQRPLNKRGTADAPMMGERLRARGESIDAVVSSPALRAQTTAELFGRACGYAVTDIAIDPDLYFLGSGTIEGVIRAQDDRLQTVMLVFHNPDITDFVNAIDYAFQVDNIPTCGLLRLSCDITHWSDWSRDHASVDYFDFPKNDSGSVLRASPA